MSPSKRERRLMEKAADQLERTLELAEKLAGGPFPPFLEETENLKRRLSQQLSAYGYSEASLQNLIFDLAEFHESCRRFVHLVEQLLEPQYATSAGLGPILGNISARIDEWRRQLGRLARTVPRFREFLSGKAGSESGPK